MLMLINCASYFECVLEETVLGVNCAAGKTSVAKDFSWEFLFDIMIEHRHLYSDVVLTMLCVAEKLDYLQSP